MMVENYANEMIVSIQKIGGLLNKFYRVDRIHPLMAIMP